MSPLPETTSRTGLLVGLVIGVPVMAYGVRGVFVDSGDTHPAELARWIIGLAVVNDALVIPLAMAVGWLARRVVPSGAWPAVRAGLLCSAVLCLVAWPFVRGYGRDPSIPSLLNRNYAWGLVAALAVVWLLVVLSLGRRSASPMAGDDAGSRRRAR